jgi:hypothetical protein
VTLLNASPLNYLKCYYKPCLSVVVKMDNKTQKQVTMEKINKNRQNNEVGTRQGRLRRNPGVHKLESCGIKTITYSIRHIESCEALFV